MNIFSQAGRQINYLLRNWVSIITFTITTILMLINFILNVLTFRGTDVNSMIEPMRMLTLSYEANTYDMRMMGIIYIPIILSVFSGLPAGLSMAKDRQLGMDVMMTKSVLLKPPCCCVYYNSYCFYSTVSYRNIA